MGGKRRAVLAVLPAIAASLACLAAQRPPDATQSPREIYKALNALRVDTAQIYAVNEIRLRRDAVSLIFSEGIFGFLQAYDGHVTGAVFSGRGHVSANLRDRAEKQSLVHFLGVPLLDQSFSRAYLRFDDGSAEEILEQLRNSGANPMNADDFASTWDKSVANLNPDQTTRLVMDWVAETPVPYFYSELVDEQLGAFDVLIDGRRAENVMIGQDRWAAGNHFYNVWASLAGSTAPPPAPPAFAPISYTVDTTIGNDRTLDGTTTIEVRAARSADRFIVLELSRFLTVQSAQDADGHALDFFQNQDLSRNQLAQSGNDAVVVFLPKFPQAGQSYRIRLSYRGNVMSDAGNGVLYVGNRGIWYPHLEGMSRFALFDTTFHWPRKFRLVATGEKVEEHEDGDRRTGRWRSEGPALLAGFNLGDYRIENMEAVEGVKIQIATNSALETAIADAVRAQSASDPMTARPMRPNRRMRPPVVFTADPPALLAGPLGEVGQQIAEAVRFGNQWMGPFPYHQLVVSQAPGTFGQGFPGLLYLPSLSFLPGATQQLVGISSNSQEALDDIIPYHEVAHQWWGNVVGWDSYRDQWLTEGLANYLALVGTDEERPGEHLLTHWLDLYRKELTAPLSGPQYIVDDAGPLVHGFRLNSSHDPDAYTKIIYGKGAWVFHMLRMMLQDPVSKNPDERFIGLLHGLLESHRYGALTTDDLQKAVEHVMTPVMDLEGGHSMDWFFAQYVRSTGVPVYELEFTARPGPKGFLVRGKLIQKNVLDDFVQRVPIYWQSQGAKPAFGDYVTTSGEETSFQFVTAALPKRLLIDPQMTVLCVSPSASTAATE
jgi:hypothetical protein